MVFQSPRSLLCEMLCCIRSETQEFCVPWGALTAKPDMGPAICIRISAKPDVGPRFAFAFEFLTMCLFRRALLDF